jgi:uncharacterized protein with PQ loop repeat
MLPCDGRVVCKDENRPPPSAIESTLRVLVVVTMLMTIPQVIAAWREPAGISVISWVTYLASSIAWLVYGLRKHDLMLWASNAGWVFLDVAIIAGATLHGS